jgi:pyrroline-5-carboxylate reductase
MTAATDPAPTGLGHVAVLGLGNMGSAIAAAVLDGGRVAATDVTGADPDVDRAAAVAEELGIETTTDNAEAVAGAEVVLLAVKPQHVATVVAEIADSLAPDTVVVSVAAGVRTDAIEAGLGQQPVVRIMPNTPLLVGRGMCVLTPGMRADDAALATAAALVEQAADVRVLPEELFDAVTAVSGSGPAYVFALAEAMVHGATDQGLAPADAVALVEQTVAGAGALLRASEHTAGELRDMVSSPGGTTLAGLARLEAHDLDGAVRDAIAAATRRGRELAG